MSEVDSLISAIGSQVDLLGNQLKEEKAHLAEVQNRLLSLIKEADAKKRSKACLEEEIKALESSFEHAVCHTNELVGASDLLSKQTACLEEAIKSIQCSSDRIRKERMAFIVACRNNLKLFDDNLWANEKLKAFVQLWASKKSANFRLTALPDPIREITNRLVGYHDDCVESLLDQALDKDAAPTSYNTEDTNMSVVTRENHLSVSKDDVTRTATGTDLRDFIVHEATPNTQLGEPSCLELSALDVCMLPSKLHDANGSLVVMNSPSTLDHVMDSSEDVTLY